MFPNASRQGNEQKRGAQATPLVMAIPARRSLRVISRTWDGKRSSPHFWPSLRRSFRGQALDRAVLWSLAWGSLVA